MEPRRTYPTELISVSPLKKIQSISSGKYALHRLKKFIIVYAIDQAVKDGLSL